MNVSRFGMREGTCKNFVHAAPAADKAHPNPPNLHLIRQTIRAWEIRPAVKIIAPDGTSDALLLGHARIPGRGIA